MIREVSMERIKLEKAMKQAKVSNEIENKQIKPEHTALVRARLNNEISEEDFQQKVKKKVLELFKKIEDENERE